MRSFLHKLENWLLIGCLGALAVLAALWGGLNKPAQASQKSPTTITVSPTISPSPRGFYYPAPDSERENKDGSLVPI